MVSIAWAKRVQLCWVLMLTAIYRSACLLITFKCQVLWAGAQKQPSEELIGTRTESFFRSVSYVRLRSVYENIAQTQFSFFRKKSKVQLPVSWHSRLFVFQRTNFSIVMLHCRKWICASQKSVRKTRRDTDKSGRPGLKHRRTFCRENKGL